MNGVFNSNVAGTPAVLAEGFKDNGVTGISLKEGIFDGPNGVFTQVAGIGVLGENNSPFGVGVQGVGNDAGGTGVIGLSTNGTAVSASSTNGIAISAQTTNGNFGVPQIEVTNNTNLDFARIRMGGGEAAPWDIAAGGAGEFNIYSLLTNQNVLHLTPNGNVTVAGALHQHSSRTFKNEIADLSSEDAIKALEQLRPVRYSYRHDQEKVRHLGFIAEDVPDLVASRDRTTICPMDVIAVLAAALQKQMSLTQCLMDRVTTLEAASSDLPAV
jgi:hypothetical protein